MVHVPRLLALLGAALAVTACAQILGVQEVGDATGGAGTTHGGSSTTGPSSSSTSAGTTSSRSTTTSSSSVKSACAGSPTCGACMQCMQTDPACSALWKTCAADNTCTNYYGCVLQCPQTSAFSACAVGSMGCNGSPITATDYVDMKDCACTVCQALCPDLCM
jgi:hypothetical protein